MTQLYLVTVIGINVYWSISAARHEQRIRVVSLSAKTPVTWSQCHTSWFLYNHYLTISHTTSQPHLPQTPSFPDLLFIFLLRLHSPAHLVLWIDCFSHLIVPAHHLAINLAVVLCSVLDLPLALWLSHTLLLEYSIVALSSSLLWASHLLPTHQ
jgi:hypothetical protein